MTPDAATPLRSDARRNRDQILRVAKEIFAEQGVSVPMEEIARRADVGVGTLYRRFPDREALIRAVFRDSFRTVATETRAALEEEPTAWDALVRIMGQSAHLRLSMRLHAYSAAVAAIVEADEESERFRRAAVDVLEQVMARAQAEGTLRRDVDVGDLTMLFVSVVHQPHNLPAEAARMAPGRVLAIMLEGLRAPAADPLPGRPLTRADVDAGF
ncbi:MAG: TetR family transcriptional regulator [Actinophytocola sp.]|uniref:TetR/AcrR family transcriptional regulator n=1 Tax=Actinophytocola sp. TaxID=1872138 RepID=UPI00132BF244|nr:TetR/AcrR family transcriptional regulator [Actinophytocola sp.]MPZ79223.1 TetR family transcriptional regulator [Actinophytocola sp.]